MINDTLPTLQADITYSISIKYQNLSTLKILATYRPIEEIVAYTFGNFSQ